MLTAEENERLTRVGPGTPMGNLMRRYWQPIAATSRMADNATRSVRLLGENLVLYKDRKGRYGLIGVAENPEIALGMLPAMAAMVRNADEIAQTILSMFVKEK